MTLTDRHCIVTGAASGIGAASAGALVEKGARVTIADRDEARGQAVAQKLGDAAAFEALDVSDDAGWSKMISAAQVRFGPLRVLVNCAGIMVPLDVEQTDWQTWQQTMNINAGGAYLGCKHAIGVMKEHGEPAAIVNVASSTALKTAPWVMAYGASKAAVLSLTRSVALHCATSGYDIRVNAVLPGVVETPMLDPILGAAPDREAAIADLRALHPIGRLLREDEIASAVLYLADDGASGITGTHIAVDGGQTAG